MAIVIRCYEKIDKSNFRSSFSNFSRYSIDYQLFNCLNLTHFNKQDLMKLSFGGWGEDGGNWVKMLTSMLGRQRKTKNKTDWNALKTKLGPKYKWFNMSYFKWFFLKIFLAYECFIFVQTFRHTSSEYLLNSRFSSRKSESQKKLGKKITHSTIQFR